ncbi:zinc-finger domain-containing protein [Inmirania thermothiophila]|uniref:Putative Zn-finger protein n=1 Tax=Inmirania thermothiophila TaxID=1750597 RepID=A0A3N1XSI0_9GAMM|nr:zinc-finger domain-containing protein [Inmirania thermothiophila]ROR29604.1 putative Zn-finger protein [Inmirania thermothiophila]
MSAEPAQTGAATGGRIPNDRRRYEVTRADLPLSCPMPGMSVWNSHPRVYLPIAEAPDGRVRCPYCGAEYVLVDGDG